MNQTCAQSIEKPTLLYPFKQGWSPEPGTPFEVSDGVFWLRMPIPISLDHINLWLLKDGDGWVIVDSGVDHQTCKAVWETVFEQFCPPERVSKVIVTHYHMDHIGLASWLALRCQCPILMTPGEFQQYHRMVTRDGVDNTEIVGKYFHSLGFDAKTRDAIAAFFTVDDKPQNARVQPEQVRFINEGDVLTIGDKHWQIVTGNGHSPEHACLYNQADNVLISGDQSLPRISSNVSVFPGSEAVNPLGDWLDSCEKLRDLIPASALILPAHQEPFQCNPVRMQHMIDEHHGQLDCLRSVLQEPLNAIGARQHLFQRKLDPVQKVLATGETMAHLRYLTQRGELEQRLDEHGVLWFQMVS